MRLKHVINILILLGFLIYDILNAQNFNDALRLSEPGLGSSARALSLGNSYTALSNDFSGGFFNPAGLGLIKKQQLFGGFSYNNFNNDVKFFNNRNSSSKSSTDLNQFGFVFPVPTSRGSLVFSIGYNRNKDFTGILGFNGFNNQPNSMIQDLTYGNDDIAFLLGVSYPLYDANDNYLGDTTVINGRLNQTGNILREGSINNYAFSGAIEVAENVFVGATFNILSGDYKNSREYTEEDTRNIYQGLTDPADSTTFDFQSFTINDILSWDISGWNLKFGVLYKLNPIINLGATIKLPSKFKIKESYFVRGNSFFGTGQQFTLDPPIDNRTEYNIKTPFEFSAGAALNLGSATLTGQFNFIDYTQMKFEDGLPQSVISQNNQDINNIFRSVVNYNFGFEYLLPFVNVAARGGFIYQKSAFKNDPSEFDKKYFTAGLGIAPDSDFSVDLAYAHGWWQTFADNYGVNESRTFQDIKKDTFILTFVYKY